jgi:hypothetical protein
MLESNQINKEAEYSKKEVAFMADDIRSKVPNYAAMYNSDSNAFPGKNEDVLGGAIDRFNSKTDTTEFSGISQNDLYADLSDNTRIAKFDAIPQNAQNIQDIEKFYADNQTTGDKWANGLMKFGGKTLAAVAGGTLGSVNGIIEMVKTGSFESSYNNDFNGWLDDLNTKMDYKLPNYYSEQEKDNNFLQSMGTANFYANDVLGGLSFTAGLIVSEGIWGYATGGTSLATMAARNASKIGKLFGRTAETASAMNTATKIAKAPALAAYSTGKISQDAAIKAGKIGEMLNTARFTYTSAGFESGQEARHYMREAKEGFLEDFESKNGREPSSDEYAKFDADLVDSGNYLFAFNMALVGSSNLAMFGKSLGITSPVSFPKKWANKSFFGIGSKTTTDGFLEVIKATRAQNIIAKTFAVAKTPIIEGVYEEGLQSVGGNTAKNWIQSTYDPKYLGETIELGDAFVKGMAETYGTKEGLKEVGIGMIIGLISGAGTSIASKEGLFGEVKRAKKDNEAEVLTRNTYTVEKTLQRIHTASRVMAFNEAGEAAEEKGDITGAELSRTSAMIAHINGAHNFGYTDQAIAEFKVGVNAMDNATLMKQYGLETESEAEAAKATMINEYNELTKEYTRQREYADLMINANSKEFKGKKNIDEVKEAIAFELTLGGKSHRLSQELLDSIKGSLAKNYNVKGQSMSTAVEVQDILWSAGRQVRQDFKEKQNQLRKANLEKARLEKQRLLLEKNRNSKEDNKQDLNELNSVTVGIQENTVEIQKLERELEGVLSAAQMQNPYTNKDQSFITAQELLDVDTNLSDVSKLVQDFKLTNPREGHRLEGLLKEYQKSKIAFTRYADLARQLQDPKLGLRGKRNIITELTSDKSPSAITLEFVEQMSANMDRIKAEEFLEQNSSTPENQQIIRKARMKPEVEIKEAVTVQDIIDQNPYLLEYVGDASNVNKPTEEEIKEYKELVKRIKRTRKIDNAKATGNKPNYYAKKGVSIPLSVAEMTRFQELNQLMSDWRFFQGATNSEDISIADLVEQEISRDEEIKQDDVVNELGVDDFVQVVTPEEGVPVSKGVEFRKSSIVQTYENVKVTVRNNNYEFSHLKISSIFDRLLNITTVIMQKPILDENGVVVKWAKSEEVTIEEALNNQKYGTKFTIVTPEGNLQVNMMDYGRLQIPIIDFSKFKVGLGFDIFKQATGKTSYSDLYEVTEDGMIQKESDFGAEEGGATYTPQEVLAITPGTNTFFKVNVTDPFNEELKARFEAGELTYAEVINQVKVYNVGVNDKVLGDLKSNKDIVDETDNFMEIRRMAAEVLLTTNAANNIITIPYTAKAAYVLLGTPNITMVNTGDGAVPKSILLTDKALERVVDYGYIENGQLKLNGNTSNVRLDFVSKLAKKGTIPVIIFKEGSYFVAYPVTLTKKDVDRVSEVNAVLRSKKYNRAEKASLINSIFSENGITPTLRYSTQDSQNMYNSEDGTLSEELKSKIEELRNKREFVDVNEWLEKNHDKNSLKEEISLTLNLEERALKSPKLILDFKNAERNDRDLPWYDNYLTTGEVSEEQIHIIANKAIAMEALTKEETDLYNNETQRIKEAVVEIVRISDEKQAEIDKNKNEEC